MNVGFTLLVGEAFQTMFAARWIREIRWKEPLSKGMDVSLPPNMTTPFCPGLELPLRLWLADVFDDELSPKRGGLGCSRELLPDDDVASCLLASASMSFYRRRNQKECNANAYGWTYCDLVHAILQDHGRAGLVILTD